MSHSREPILHPNSVCCEPPDNPSSPASTWPPPLAKLSRRELLILSGAALSALILPGCGGGSGKVSANTTNAGRTLPTGDLKNQLNQYSSRLDHLSGLWSAPSNDVAALTTPLPTRDLAADDGGTAYFQTAFIGLRGLKTAYTYLLDQALTLDDIGAFSQAVAKNNNLQGTADVSNPQWTVAMMHRNVDALVLLGIGLETLQTVGLNEMMQVVQEATDPDTQLIAYAVLAQTFNGWVGRLSAQAGSAIDPTWLLDVSASVTNAVVLQEVGRIDDILGSLPFGPRNVSVPTDAGLTSQGVAPSRDGIGGMVADVAKGLAESFLEELIRLAKNPADDIEQIFKHPNDFLKDLPGRIFVDRTKLLQFIKGRFADALLEEVLKSVFKEFFKKTSPKQADCIAELILDFLDIIKLAIGTYGALQTGVGAIFLGGLVTLLAIDIQMFISKLNDCFGMLMPVTPKKKKMTMDRIPDPVQDITDKTKTFPGTRRLKARIVVNAETDQIRTAQVVKGKLLSQPRKQQPVGLKAKQLALKDVLPAAARNTIFGPTPQSESTNTSAQVTFTNPNTGQPETQTFQDPNQGPGKRVSRVLGRADSNPALFYTYDNIELSATLLLIGLAEANPDTVNPTVDDDGVSFFEAQGSLVLRRESGTTEADIPAITGGQLLCTAPGYVPMKAIQSTDFTTLAEFPPLQPISGLSPGGSIHVN